MTRALLLDLGNVVLEVDFRRTFRHWGAISGTDPRRLEARWALDDAYEAHETGSLTFQEYTEALGARLGIEMPLTDWHAGWNALFVGPYARVSNRLAELARAMPVYAFTNTNPTHEAEWRQRYPEPLTHFREIYVSSTLGLRKPDPAAFQHVAECMAHAPSEILFIDDTLENVEGARSAGLDAEWVQSEADVLAVLDRY